MKNLRLVLCVLTVLLAATATWAQQIKMKANVPFDFIAGDRAYPAGEYSLTPVSSDSVVMRITSTENIATNYLLPSYTCSNATASTQTKLVFRHVGDMYFLDQVWIEGRTAGRQFPIGHTEAQLARNQEKSDLVIVAANLSH